MESGELTVLFLRQRPTALLSVHEALLLVSRFVPNVCCCAGSLPLACSSFTLGIGLIFGAV